MASLTNAAAGLASSASLCGVKVGLSASPKAAAPGHNVAMVSVKAAKQSEEEVNEREVMKRRALFVGAFAAVLATASSLQNEAAIAEEDPKKKRNKCPKICVANPTASCCFSY